MISKLRAVIIDNSLDMRKGFSLYRSVIRAHVVAHVIALQMYHLGKVWRISWSTVTAM
jgi:hypothetical protein